MSESRSPGTMLGFAGTVEQNGSVDAYDALADLFLGESGHGTPERAGGEQQTMTPPRRTPVELLMLGHLPVLGSAWAMQYARQASSDVAAPVAMLRLRGGEISLEVVGGPEREVEPTPSLQAAIEAAAPLVRRWIVRVDDMAEPLALQLRGVDVVTLLSGADEAAVVSAYQIIKEVPSGRDLEVKLTIMGAAPERAIAAADRIAKTASTHLGRKITVAACISRIGGGRTALYHRGPLVGDEVTVLSAVLQQIRSPRSVQATAPVQRPAISAPSERGRIIEPKPMPARELPDQPGPLRPGAAETMSGEELRAASSNALHLGLELLPFRSPIMGEVELAVDQEGRLHLVGAADERLSAFAALHAAAIWAKQNADVVRLAAGTCGKPVSLDHAPVMHLVTSNARWVRPVLDGEIRLHMLGSVRIGGRQAWCVMDLN